MGQRTAWERHRNTHQSLDGCLHGRILSRWHEVTTHAGNAASAPTRWHACHCAGYSASGRGQPGQTQRNGQDPTGRPDRRARGPSGARGCREGETEENHSCVREGDNATIVPTIANSNMSGQYDPLIALYQLAYDRPSEVCAAKRLININS
jgi:hypothetical protein